VPLRRSDVGACRPSVVSVVGPLSFNALAKVHYCRSRHRRRFGGRHLCKSFGEALGSVYVLRQLHVLHLLRGSDLGIRQQRQDAVRLPVHVQ
jgi:hypothetical protein